MVMMSVNRNFIIIGIMSLVFFSCIGKNSDNVKGGKSAADSISDIQNGSGNMFLFIGTYTSQEGSKGIYVHSFDTGTGHSEPISMVEVKNPSYLAISNNEKFVYSVGENNEDESSVSAFALNKDKGSLSLINSQTTRGSGPCYISIDRQGRNVHTANYGGGSISSFHVNNDGSLSELNSLVQFKGSGLDSTRQKNPHLHSVRYSPDGKFLFAADLGTDKLYRFTNINAPFEGQPSFTESSLKEFVTPPRTGPRHFDFHPGGAYLYLLGELSGEVIVYDYNDGDLIQKQTIAADTTNAKGSADIHVSPDGMFLYASNRLKNDGIAIFSINQEDGTLSKVGYQLTGRHPRNFVLTPNGDYLLVACRDDNMIQVFSVDSDSGLLTDTNLNIQIDKPVCLKFASMN